MVSPLIPALLVKELKNKQRHIKLPQNQHLTSSTGGFTTVSHCGASGCRQLCHGTHKTHTVTRSLVQLYCLQQERCQIKCCILVSHSPTPRQGYRGPNAIGGSKQYVKYMTYNRKYGSSGFPRVILFTLLSGYTHSVHDDQHFQSKFP